MREIPSAILQELESDDELPDVYNDVVILPAYLDDNRFDEIKFAWVTNVDLKSPDTPNSNTTSKIVDESKHCKQQMKGVLKRHDLFCLKSIEEFTCSTTLIWFVNFLLYKDLHSHYNHLRSCLVSDLISTIPVTNKPNRQSEEHVQSERLEIVIKS